MNLKVRMILATTLLGLGLISGCSGWTPAPGDSKYANSSSQTPDGYYRVKRGDTLHAIAFKFGMDWRNIAQWNGIQSPYTIYPDQDLRLMAPGTQASQQGVPAASRTSSGSSASENGIVVTAAPSKSSTSTTYDVPPETTYTPAPVPAPVPAPDTKADTPSPAQRLHRLAIPVRPLGCGLRKERSSVTSPRMIRQERVSISAVKKARRSLPQPQVKSYTVEAG